MSKKINIGILWANPYNPNLGVGALAYSSIFIFHDILNENNIDADITVIGSQGKYKEAIYLNGNKVEFNNLPAVDYFYWKSFFKILFKYKKFKIHKLFSTDIVFDISEGDSFTDIYGSKRFKKIINLKRIFLSLKKPLVLLPQTIGPFNVPRCEKQAFDVMKKAEMVISRDKKSYDYTSEFLPKEKIAEAIDVAFYMPYEKKVFANDNINVGLNVSGLLWNGGYTQKNQFNLEANYQELIEEIIKYFLAIKNVKLHLVSHVISNNEGSVEDDYHASKMLKQKYQDVELAPKFTSPIDAKSYISGMDFFSGARMHACIAAYSSKVPVLPLAYSRKFNGLFVDTLRYDWVGDCVNEDTNVIMEKLKKAFELRNELKWQIENSHENIVQPRLQELKRLLSGIVLKQTKA